MNKSFSKKYSWSIKELNLPLLFTWKISRNSCDFKINFLIQVQNEDLLTGQGEVAFNVRYGETLEYVYSEFHRFQSICPKQTSLESLDVFLRSNKFPSSLSFAIESAFAHLRAKENKQSMSDFLSLKQVNDLETSFSIPILEDDKLEQFLIDFNLARFRSLKLKINEHDNYLLINHLLKLTSVPIRIDANEAFSCAKDVLLFLDKINSLERIEFMEQPLHTIDIHEQVILKKDCPILLAADESVIRDDLSEDLGAQFDIINIKLMKAGSYQNAISQLKKAKELGLQTMLGCMVETTLGISSAMNLAELVDIFDLDGFLFLQSDPFDLVGESNGLLNLKKHGKC